MKKIITICAFAACLTGCDDLFEPAIENNLGLEYMYENSQCLYTHTLRRLFFQRRGYR